MATTKIVSFSNQKGGVGKSTMCLQTAYELAIHEKKKVLVIDMDAQGNTSSRLAPRVQDEHGSWYPVYSGTRAVHLFQADLQDIEVMPCPSGVDLIHTLKNDPELFEKEAVPLDEAFNPRVNLMNFLERNHYDYVLIDCPPSLGRKLVAALNMSTHVVAPVKLSGFAIDGLEGLLNTIINIQGSFNPDLKITGIIINDMVNSKSHTKALTLIRQMVPDLVFENIVMNRAPIDTATSDGVPLWELQYGHVAAKEIKAVIHELIARVNAQ
ncbi:ParA family protein [Comamonas jiangduensis]|uniref:ParA family protein n=1 Tax=Comamonas jiangduensis TaxID=1194168 RepID=UPI003BF7960F